MADRIEPTNPLLTLARLLADQTEDRAPDSSDRWLRRLNRWREYRLVSDSDQLRFMVVLDGLNERSGMLWADTIDHLKTEVKKLGGCLVLTCREGFWDREIAPRLADVSVRVVHIGGYSPEELNALLKQRGVAADTISSQVLDFIRNPRICSIAIDLLENISLQVDELTVERLLLEYWCRRLKERGDRTIHNISDFENLLKSHAKRFREAPGIQFDRDHWRDHSGAARRADGRTLENDLSDIEEGAFLRIVPDRDGFYEFKPDTVPFALGLLIAHELQDELLKLNPGSPMESVDRIIDEIRGFDLVGEALRAAAGIACFKAKYQASGRKALISAWLQVQNVEDSAYDYLVAYVPACPEAILDAIEIEFDERSNGSRRDWLVAALLQKRSHQNVQTAINTRINRWLGRWSRVPQVWTTSDNTTQSQRSEKAKPILDKLANLTPIERAFLAEKCYEVDSPETAHKLDSLAAKLMAGGSQVQCAEGLLAWAFTWAITGGYRNGEADLCWSIRLNTTDFEAFEHGLRRAIDRLLTEPHSEVSKETAALALRVIGTVNGALEAEQLNPREYRKGWRAIENYCQTDPYDPDSVRPENLENAINSAQALNPDTLWTSVSFTQELYELESITPALARFEPDVIVPILRAACKTIRTRSSLSLRQLSWVLPRLSPLFDEDTLQCVLEGYEQLLPQPSLVDENDKTFVAGFILLSLLPHYSANDQLALFLKLPAEVREMYAFRDSFKALDEMKIEKALVAAQSDPKQLVRTCFFISAHRPTLTDHCREILGRALIHDDPIVVICASDVAFIAQDKLLYELVVTAAKQRDTRNNFTKETFHRDRAIAAAVVSLNLREEIPLVAPQFLDIVASKLNVELADRMDDSSVDSFGHTKIPQEAISGFAGPDIDALKKALVLAKTDAELQTLIYAAEQAGHIDWLGSWIANEVATEVPGSIARGLMAEGLRNFGSVTSPFLSCDWGPGILGEVAKQARFAHERNIWAQTWASKAIQATNPLDFWRWGELTVGIADVRAYHWFDLKVDNPLVERFGKELFKRIRDASEKRTKKREETLFGIKKPDRILIESQKLSSWN